MALLVQMYLRPGAGADIMGRGAGLVTITLTNSVASLCNIKWTGNNDKLSDKILVDKIHFKCVVRVRKVHSIMQYLKW